MMDWTKAGIIASVGLWIAAILVATGWNFWAGVAVWVASLAVFLKCYDARARAKKAERMAALVRFGAERMDGMTGVQFEQMLAAVFTALGYGVSATPTTGDYGADLVMTRGSRKIAVQVKRLSHNVGNKAVQEATAGALHYGAHEAWVVTNAGFTRGAVEQARSAGVVLVDRDALVRCVVLANGAAVAGPSYWAAPTRRSC
ncbi:MAG: restriction endonuclease [Gemmatimonadota bacterium]|nr:restriction endonuclease [Gemmatimonadota bacterium]